MKKKRKFFVSGAIFSCRGVCLWNVLRTYKVTSFLFVTIFFYVQFIYRRLIKLKVIIFLVLELSSWLQQLLGKTYGLRYQNGVMVNDSFIFRKTKSCIEHVLFVAGDFVTESQRTNMNDQKNIQPTICRWQQNPKLA